MGRTSYSSKSETRALERGTKSSSYAERTTAQKVLAFVLALILTVESLFNNGVSTAFAETLADGLGNQPGTEQVDGNVDGQKDNNTDPDDPTDLNDPENTTEPGDPKDPSDSPDSTDLNKDSEPSNAEEGDGDTNISDPNKDETPDPNTTTETEAETPDPNKADISDPVESETPDPNTTQTEAPDPNTTTDTETETPDPNTTTETDADPVEVEVWDWTGKTDNLTLSSPDGLAFDTEAFKAIVEEAQATADSSDDEAEANASDETEAGSEDTTDQTDNATDQTENDQTTNEVDTTTPADVLRTLLSEQLDATLDLSFQLNPSVDDIDTGNHTVVLPGDSFTVTLPEGMAISGQMVDNDKHSFDIFQSDEEGNPTTLKIAEGTVKNEGTTLKVTFVEPVETADAKNTTAYYVGAPTEGTVPATQTEGKEQVEKLNASIDLKVAVKSELLTDEASELTWTLQTKADDESVKQETTLALPGMTELADQLGVVVPAPEEPQEQEGEKDDQADDETTVPPSTNDIEPLAVGDTTVVLDEYQTSRTSLIWIDNNDTSHRGTLDEYKNNLNLYVTVGKSQYLLRKDEPLTIQDSDSAYIVPAETVNKLIEGLTSEASGNTWTASASLPHKISFSTEMETGEVNREFPVSWSITYTQPSGEQANASDHWYKLTPDQEDPTKQYMQLLKDVSFTFVGKLGNDSFESAFGTENADFKITEVVNNKDGNSGKLEEYFTFSEQPKPINNQVTISDRFPAYDLNGLPIEYKVTYGGPQEGSDYYQATYKNSASGNHGSDVNAMWNGGTLTLTHAGTTQFDATKDWQDNGEGNRPQNGVTYTLWRYSTQALPSTSGTGGTGVAPAVEDPYATAAQVKIDGRFATVTMTDMTKNTFSIGNLFIEKFGTENDKGEKVLDLPKYDPEGYPYIYAVREDQVDKYEQIFGDYNEETGLYEDQSPQYAKVDGTLDSALGDSWDRDENDVFVYNGGTISNHLSETIGVKQNKTWKISAFQDQLQDVDVTFTLYQHVKQTEDHNIIDSIVSFFTGDSSDKTWAPARDVDGNVVTKTIEGFKSETLTQTISGYYPKYGPLGNELEYRWVETGVTQTLADGTTFDTSFKLKDENDPTQGATFQLQLTSAEGTAETLQFASSIEDDGTIVNAFANETDQHVDKWWELPGEDGNGSGKFVQYYPSGVKNPDSTAKMSLYRDNQLIGTFTMDGEKDAQPQPILENPSDDLADFEGATWQETRGYHIDFEGLPQYSETGHKYSYLVIEGQKDGWYATRDYDDDTRTTTIRNFIPEGEGSLIYVSKEWVDGSDSAHRNTSVVQLIAKKPISNQDKTLTYEAGEVVTQIGANSFNNTSDTVRDGKIYLSEKNGWFAEITIGINDLTADDFEIVELGLQDSSADGSVATFWDTYANGQKTYGKDADGKDLSYKDAQTDASVNQEIWAHTGWDEGDAPRIATDEHVYEVTYGTTTFNVGGEDSPVLTVRNRRIGIVNLNATKTWVDTLADEDADKRPDAELVLSCDMSGEDHVTFSIGDGENGTTEGQVYVQLPGGNKIPLYSDYNHAEGEVAGEGVPLMAAASKAEAKEGEPYLDGDTLVVPIDKKQDTQSFEFLGLPKYDGYGEVHNYTIKERWVGERGEYRTTTETSPYEVGPLHFNDSQTFEFSNQPVDTVTKVFYKQWKDTYVNEQQNQRPDIYLTLYKVSGETGDKPVPVDGYVHFLWENAETVQGEDPNYWQKVTISGLDKYDELGDEIQYYATESMSITNPADLDYTDVSFSDEKTNYDPDDDGKPVEGTEFDGDTTKFKVYVGTETGDAQQEDYAHWAIHAGGTFVNRIDSNLIANGTKIWRNVPGDFDLEDDMPEITVYLQRRIVPEDSSTAWADPEVVKKDGYSGNPDEVFWNDEGSAAAGYGVEKKCSDGSEIVAYTVTFKKDAATNQWTYQLWHTGLNGAADDESQARLPKYDENGNLYQYRALEAMWGLAGSAAWGEDAGEQLDPTDAVKNVFDVSHGETGSFILTNAYDSPEGNLTVRKIFDGREEGDNYPNVTFTLYRQYATADGNLSKAEAVGSPKTISREEFKQSNGLVDVTFENLDIYAANGGSGQ